MQIILDGCLQPLDNIIFGCARQVLTRPLVHPPGDSQTAARDQGFRIRCSVSGPHVINYSPWPGDKSPQKPQRQPHTVCGEWHMQIILDGCLFQALRFCFYSRKWAVCSEHRNQSPNPNPKPNLNPNPKTPNGKFGSPVLVPYAASFWLVQEIKQNNSISIQRRTHTHSHTLKDEGGAEAEVYVIVFTYKFNFVFGTKIDFHVTKARSLSPPAAYPLTCE